MAVKVVSVVLMLVTSRLLTEAMTVYTLVLFILYQFISLILILVAIEDLRRRNLDLEQIILTARNNISISVLLWTCEIERVTFKSGRISCASIKSNNTSFCWSLICWHLTDFPFNINFKRIAVSFFSVNTEIIFSKRKVSGYCEHCQRIIAALCWDNSDLVGLFGSQTDFASTI